MPYRNAPPNKNFYGWFRDMVNNKLELYDGAGTKVAEAAAAAFGVTGALTASTTLGATTTVTGGTGVIATTGNVTSTAGDLVATAGNLKLNAPGAFSSTQPVGAAVFMTGTAPAGTITTGGAVFTDGTTMKKIIAANTVSDIQT